MKQSTFAWGVCILCILFVCIVYAYTQSNFIHLRPHVKSIHVVNLDKDTHRWASMEKNIPIEPIRWSAIYGKDLTQTELAKLGVGYAMTRSGIGSYSEQGNNLRNQGVVGCYLSHRNLLEHLASLPVPDHYGHLIVEDDVTIPRNFLHPSDEWHKVYYKVPTDWDIVYMDITKPVGHFVEEGVMKLAYTIGEDSGNWGTHSYLVKHSSIRTKLLPWLAYMVDALDEQYKMKFNEWNVYAVVPGIIPLNEEQSANSSIQIKA